jgi:hypothetical protein
MAVIILLFLPSFPFSATFLSPRERAIAQARLDRDQKPMSHGGMTGWQGFKVILTDMNAWLFMLIYTPCGYSPHRQNNDLLIRVMPANIGVSTISYFLPTVSAVCRRSSSSVSNPSKTQLIKDLGFSSINAQGMTVPPYAVGWVFVVSHAWHSDRTGDRGLHTMLSTVVASVGYVILATVVGKSVGAAYFALFLVVAGNYSLLPLVM